MDHWILRALPLFALAACGHTLESIPRAPDGSPRPPICEGVAPFARDARRFPEIRSTYTHSCALFQDGRVACWGENSYRQLGDGTWDRRNLPTPVRGVADAIDLAVAEYGTCVARSSGSVFCWGNPWGPDPAEVPGMRGAVAIAVWGGTACGVRADGSVVCTGLLEKSTYLRTSTGPVELSGIDDAIDVTLGDAGICVLHACGRVSCASLQWTEHEGEWRLADLTPIGGLDDARAVVMASFVNTSQYERTCALRASGRVACFSRGEGIASPPDALGAQGGFVGIGGGNGICALSSDGRASCFGPTLLIRKPEEREAPDEVKLDNPVSVSNGGAFRCAGLASGKLACWGRSLGAETGELLRPMPLGNDSDVKAVALGRIHTCVVRGNGDVGCWGPIKLVNGYGDDGHAGYSYMGGNSISGLHFIADIDAGDGFVCARTQAGEIFCFGRNDKGQLGDGPRFEDRQLPTPVESATDSALLVAGPTYACAARRGGEVRCWGAHPLSERLGSKPSLIPELAGAVELAAGDHHLCARIVSDRIACVGAMPDMDWSRAKGVSQIVAGRKHICARLSSGRVICQGTALSALGASELPEPAAHIAAGGDETCAALASGRVVCWGAPSWAAPPPWSLITDAERVYTSGTHACVMRKGGDLACWGSSDTEQLGEGPREVRYPPTEIPLSPAR